MAESKNTSSQLPWYSEGLSFECTQCGNCCSGPETGFVWVTEEEIVQIATAIGMENSLGEFEKKFTRQVGNRVSLVEYSDGDCIFLHPEHRNCTVYNARPSQCRTWPFWESNLKTSQAWAKAAVGCPGCNQGELYSLEDIRARLEQKS
jgi:Fe-S-cluster containining protein